MLLRRAGVTGAPRERELAIFTEADIVQRFKRRRGRAEDNRNIFCMLLRVSTGIEDSEDLIADLDNAFRIVAEG